MDRGCTGTIYTDTVWYVSSPANRSLYRLQWILHCCWGNCICMQGVYIAFLRISNKVRMYGEQDELRALHSMEFGEGLQRRKIWGLKEEKFTTWRRWGKGLPGRETTLGKMHRHANSRMHLKKNKQVCGWMWVKWVVNWAGPKSPAEKSNPLQWQ